MSWPHSEPYRVIGHLRVPKVFLCANELYAHESQIFSMSLV